MATNVCDICNIESDNTLVKKHGGHEKNLHLNFRLMATTNEALETSLLSSSNTGLVGVYRPYGIISQIWLA